jgi:hypothetical protein
VIVLLSKRKKEASSMDKAYFNTIGPSSQQKMDSRHSISYGTSREDPLKRQSSKHSSTRDKTGNPPKDFFSYSLDLNKGKDSKKYQPTFPLVPLGWGEMPSNWNLYFP